MQCQRNVTIKYSVLPLAVKVHLNSKVLLQNSSSAVSVEDTSVVKLLGKKLFIKTT